MSCSYSSSSVRQEGKNGRIGSTRWCCFVWRLSLTLCCSALVLAVLCKSMQYLYFKAITTCALKPLFHLLHPFLPLPRLIYFLPLALLYVHNCLILSANFLSVQADVSWSGHQTSLNWGNHLAHMNLLLSSTVPLFKWSPHHLKGRDIFKCFSKSPLPKNSFAQGITLWKKMRAHLVNDKSSVMDVAVFTGGQVGGKW